MRTGWSGLSIVAMLGLAGCAASRTEAPGPVVAASPPAAAPMRAAPLLGSNSASLAGRFGDPDLVVIDGPARKLQFNQPACVLDLYLYAPHEGAEPVVIHADARDTDGRATDLDSCVAALEGGSARRRGV